MEGEDKRTVVRMRCEEAFTAFFYREAEKCKWKFFSASSLCLNKIAEKHSSHVSECIKYNMGEDDEDGQSNIFGSKKD